jgi:flagellar assembly protein FliH
MAMRLPPEALLQAGFRRDPRFTPPEPESVTDDGIEPTADPPAEPEPVDPLATAFEEGYAAGLAQGRDEADRRAAQDAAAREALSLALARTDLEHVETFAARLRETVAALCEATLAPVALDAASLAARAERAAALFAEADGAVTIRFHPDDVALVAPALGGNWAVAPDPILERGAIRVENAAGGVEDGPAVWRCAIEEALNKDLGGQC